MRSFLTTGARSSRTFPVTTGFKFPLLLSEVRDLEPLPCVHTRVKVERSYAYPSLRKQNGARDRRTDDFLIERRQTLALFGGSESGQITFATLHRLRNRPLLAVNVRPRSRRRNKYRNPNTRCRRVGRAIINRLQITAGKPAVVRGPRKYDTHRRLKRARHARRLVMYSTWDDGLCSAPIRIRRR